MYANYLIIFNVNPESFKRRLHTDAFTGSYFFHSKINDNTVFTELRYQSGNIALIGLIILQGVKHESPK